MSRFMYYLLLAYLILSSEVALGPPTCSSVFSELQDVRVRSTPTLVWIEDTGHRPPQIIWYRRVTGQAGRSEAEAEAKRLTGSRLIY